MDNNATLANEICRLCTAQPETKVSTLEWIRDNSVYSAGGKPPTGLISFDNPYIIGAFCVITILIMVICACFVKLHQINKKVKDD
jgi:hypothetical protein